MARLRDQNALLKATVDEMKRGNVTLKADLMADFGKLLDRFTDQQESTVSTSINSAQAVISSSIAAGESHAAEQASQLATLSTAASEVANQLERSQTSLVARASVTSNDVTQASGELGTKMDAFASAIEDDLSSTHTATARGHEEISALTTKAREEIESRTKAQSAKIKASNTKLTETFDSIASHLQSSAEDVAAVAKQVGGVLDERQDEVKVWSEQMGGGLRGLSSDSNALLAGKFREDKSTGQTPQKKAWKMPGRWTLVPANREDAIEAGRQVTDTLLSSVATADDMPSSDVPFEPFSEAHFEEAAGLSADVSVEAAVETPTSPAVPTHVDTSQDLPPRSSTRPLRELPFGHSNLPVSASNEDLAPIKVVDSATAMPKSRSAKNKLAATALPVSKRARS